MRSWLKPPPPPAPAAPAAPAAPDRPRPAYGPMDQAVAALAFLQSEPGRWYPPLLVSAAELGERFLRADLTRRAGDLLRRLEPEPYTDFLLSYYEEGRRRFGPEWRYADIVTVLLGLAGALAPAAYLEIGVRRGRSAAAVASQAPGCDLYLFDLWRKNYAGVDNPGPELVQAELDKVGHRGGREFVSGDSHQTLPLFLESRPDLAFDLITVDGDHSPAGAWADLATVLPRLKLGGAVVFDDLSHPKHLYLNGIWRDLVAADPRFSAWSFTDLGFGVAFALRKW